MRALPECSPDNRIPWRQIIYTTQEGAYLLGFKRLALRISAWVGGCTDKKYRVHLRQRVAGDGNGTVEATKHRFMKSESRHKTPTGVINRVEIN